MKRSQGFTVIELIIVAVIFGAASIIFFVQKNDVELASRNTARKTAINALYYSLEEVYYLQHKNYPTNLTTSALPSVDPALFKDPAGIMIGEATSDYRYEPTNCTNTECHSYTLRTRLEHEADYVQTSRHQ